MKYQVGYLYHFKEDDPEFDERDAAERHALKLSEDEYEECFGLWTGQDDGSELLAIAHNGELFAK